MSVEQKSPPWMYGQSPSPLNIHMCAFNNKAMYYRTKYYIKKYNKIVNDHALWRQFNIKDLCICARKIGLIWTVLINLLQSTMKHSKSTELIFVKNKLIKMNLYSLTIEMVIKPFLLEAHQKVMRLIEQFLLSNNYLMINSVKISFHSYEDDFEDVYDQQRLVERYNKTDIIYINQTEIFKQIMIYYTPKILDFEVAIMPNIITEKGGKNIEILMSAIHIKAF